MGFINTKEYEIYTKHNKSLWFLTPLLSEDKRNHRDFLFQSNLLNTYLRGFKYDETLERPLYLHYIFSDTEEFKSLEEYLTMDLGGNTYIDTLDISEKEIIIVYNITNEVPYPDNSLKEPHDSCVTDYDCILEGKYSKISTRHKLRILNFFYDKGCGYDNFLRLLFGRSEILWEMRKKNLGCRLGDECLCQVTTILVETIDSNNKKVMIPKLGQKQPYQKCSKFSEWKMPKGDIELESKINLIEETYGQSDAEISFVENNQQSS